MTARLNPYLGHANNTSPPDDTMAARDAYVEGESHRRAEGPHTEAEVNDAICYGKFPTLTLRQMADALNKKDDAELGRLLRTIIDGRRSQYFEEEVEAELNKEGR